MRLLSDSVGRKVVMAVTGLLMVLFVIGHLLGNLQIFVGPDGINSYAQRLHELVPVVWGTRVVMGVSVLLHVYLGITVTMENASAKPDKYAVATSLRATTMSKTMIWTGAIIGLFVLYHLAQFTLHLTPDVLVQMDGDRTDVFAMVVNSLGKLGIAALYVVAVIALFLHLGHGIQSAFQTLGLSNAFLLPRYGTAGKVASGLFLLGFGSIPVAIAFGLLR